MHDGRAACTISELVEQHYALLDRFAYRLSGSAADAEDLTQQTFLIAQMRLDQLREPQQAKAWLCRILRNVYLKGLRGRQGTPSVPLDSVPEPADGLTADARIEPQEIQQILDELPEEFRTPLILFYFQEFSYKEIAEQMEVPIGTVMSRLARAKSHLRGRLTAYQPAASEP